MKMPRLAFPALFMIGGLLLTIVPVFAKPDYAKKEKKGCTTCHTSMKSKDLNDVGKCYGEKKSLDQCQAAKPAN